jgi:succinate dehydrogenase/fumarate reductase flavoprotein subunit
MATPKFQWMNPPAPIDETLVTETLQSDIVVIGAGHAGTALARAAAEQGANLIVLDKQRSFERQIVPGHEVGVLNSSLALSRGVRWYDPMDMVVDWQMRSINRTNVELVRQFAYRGGESFDWYIAPLSQEFRDSIKTYMHPAVKSYTDTYNGFKSFLGTALFYGGEGYHLLDAVKTNQRVAMEHGAQFYFGYAGEQLIMENERAVGVYAKKTDGTYAKVLGSKAVVIAAGGCTTNNEMVHDLYEELDEVFGHDAKLNGMGVDDGSGIKMGVWAGGRVQPGPRAAVAPCVSFMAGQFSGTAFLRLNRHGKRYTNEGFMGAFGAGLATFRQPKGFVTAVFDSNWRDELNYQAPDHTNINVCWPELMERLEKDMERVVAAGKEGAQIHGTTNMEGGDRLHGDPIYCCDTLEELGQTLGYEGESLNNFLRSIERYNELCIKGVDEDFGKDPRQMHAIVKAPFFGTRSQLPIPLGPMTTLSGLEIDEAQRVLNADGDPIPGLHASGNSSGGRFALQYSTPMSGVSIGMAITLGRLLGLSLAE